MEFLKEINENKDVLLQLVNDLLDYSKIEANTMEYNDGEVDVNALILETCIAVGQVVGNLLRNALKFTEQGCVKVGYRRLSNQNFYFYVADTGCGIEEESRRAIFERFVKMNYNIRGTGLGLSICKSILEN